MSNDEPYELNALALYPPAALTFLRVAAGVRLTNVFSTALNLPRILELDFPYQRYVFSDPLGNSSSVPPPPPPPPPPLPLRSFSAPETIGDPRGIGVLAARAPNLERLILNSLTANGWSALSRLHSLRVLRLSTEGQLPPSAHFTILAELPHFQRLYVALQGQGQEDEFTADHLLAISRSRSWRSIGLIGMKGKWIERKCTILLPPSVAADDMEQLNQVCFDYRHWGTAKLVRFQLEQTGSAGGGGQVEMQWIAVA